MDYKLFFKFFNLFLSTLNVKEALVIFFPILVLFPYSVGFIAYHNSFLFYLGFSIGGRITHKDKHVN